MGTRGWQTFGSGATWIVLGALCVGGCKREAVIDGFETWRFGHTTAKDGVVCTPRKNDLTFCSQNGPITIAEQTGEVNLFFRGHGDAAPLIEIELEFRRCPRPQAIGSALASKLGAPSERMGPAVIWTGKKVVIFARLPAEDGVCLVHFVIPDDQDRLAALRKEAAQ